ncbi:DUF1146 domain-containing protein [Pasteuria penetrans]|uniref:DUF1146 domain-containing protein n=1 Tax=Pasteuria penetrans TaxID=86005 RepID=UPI000F98769C|nr:DUF1146 domain-containing protein [Pasteuria penetrans]
MRMMDAGWTGLGTTPESALRLMVLVQSGVHLLVILLSVVVCWFALHSINWGHLLIPLQVRRYRVLLIVLAMVFGFGLTQFFFDCSDWSQSLIYFDDRNGYQALFHLPLTVLSIVACGMALRSVRWERVLIPSQRLRARFLVVIVTVVLGYFLSKFLSSYFDWFRTFLLQIFY